MAVDWLHLLPALALLLTPVILLQGRRTRHRVLEVGWEGYWPRSLSYALHWVDLLRAAAGAALLVAALAPPIEISPGAERYPPLFVRGGIVLLAFLLQLGWSGERRALQAPFAYAAGLALGTLSPVVAVFALALALVIAVGANLPGAFFATLALAGAGLAFLLGRLPALLDAATLAPALLAPWLLATLLGRPFAATYRARGRAAGPTSPLK